MGKKTAFILATFFGVGYSPRAPGTAGSLAALPLAFACAYFAGAWGVLAAATAVFFIGAAACREVLKHTDHDPGFIVIDEVAGQLVSLLPIANLLRRESGLWWLCFLGFALFRLFDITKPWPANWADRKIRSAWGVMLDDIFAAMWACVALSIFAYIS